MKVEEPCELYYEKDKYFPELDECRYKKKSEKCLKGFVPKGCPEYHELTDDPYDNLVDEEPEIRNCVVSFEQVCLIGNFSELYDCPENSDEYKFNLNNPENIYNGIC